MAFTPESIAKIRQKEAQTPDALKRDPGVNYYEGWFFVTLNTRDNVPVLSWCVGDPSATEGSPDAPRCEYTALGDKVKECWQMISKFHPDVKVAECEVMPEHFHGLLYLPSTNTKHLGRIIYGFMVGCSHAYWDSLGIDWRNMKDTPGAIAHRWQDRDHTRSYRGPALFVHGYNDMEPITPEEVEVKRAYIRDQARKRLIQGDRHECFLIRRHQHSRNWTLERTMNAISANPSFRSNAERRTMAQKNVADRLIADDGMLGLDYIGNKALLYAERKLSLVCHRVDAARFEQQRDAVLKAAREGCVIVSAFISPRERDIRQQLMAEGLPLIEVMDNGFADKYKGVGKSFYALAENRLLQITPWTYRYQKDGTQISREMCLVMNELALTVSGARDDWWKG